MRGADYLGVFSGNKFGLILKDCSPDDLTIAADRLLAGVRNDTIPTSAGPVSVTITIGGVTAPRNAKTLEEILWRAQDALDVARSRRHGSFMAYKPDVKREAQRQHNLRATDEIIAALNERRIALAYEPVVHAATRQVSFYEGLMRVERADGSLAHANEIIPVAERVGLVRLLDHRVLQNVIGELRSAHNLKASVNVSPSSTNDPSWWNGLCCARIRAPASGLPSRSPRPPQSATSTRRAGLSPASRTSAARSRSTISAPARPRSAICANSPSTFSRSTARSCRTSAARKTTAPSCRPCSTWRAA
jgi:hypothetical protein